jgi:hypothetical protein
MRLKLNRAHAGLLAVALVFASSMTVLGGRAWQQSQRQAEKSTIATRPPVDGHRVSLASARGR